MNRIPAESRAYSRYPFLADETALEQFIRDWNAGTLSRPAWTHAAHIAVASYYAFDRDVEALFSVMRPGILSLNERLGTANTEDSGYHETLTRFWSTVLVAFAQKQRLPSRFELVDKAVETYGEARDFHRAYYSFDVVKDRRARREWVAPDLQSL